MAAILCWRQVDTIKPHWKYANRNFTVLALSERHRSHHNSVA